MKAIGGRTHDVSQRAEIASLLILRSDPLASTAAFDAIETVIVKGRVVRREALSASVR